MSGCNFVHEGSGKILALAAAMLLVVLMLACSSDTVTPDATIVLSPDATAAPNPTATLAPLPPVPTPVPPVAPLHAGDPLLYRAIWAGSLDDLREQIALGKEVNASNEQGDPFLYTAIWRGGPDKVQALVDAGADVNVRDSGNDPMLYTAMWRGETEALRILVDASADVDARDSDNDPLLYTAVWRGETEAVRILVDAGADVDARDSDNDPLLYTAVWRGETEAVRILVDAGADVNARDSDNDPLLYTAVWRGETEAVRILVDAGADVNARRANGESLLYVANWRGQTEIEQILVDAGADVSAVDSGGDSPQLDATPISTHSLAPGDVLTFKDDFFGIHIELELLEVVTGYAGDERSDIWLDSGNEWVKVVIEVKNLGEDEYSSLRSFDFALVDANYSKLGDTFGAPDTGYLIEGKEIAPGATVRGDVVLQAPISKTFLALSVEPIFSDAQYLSLPAGLTAIATPGLTATPGPTATPRPTRTPAPPILPPSVEVAGRSSSSLTLSVWIFQATYYEIRRRAATAPVEWTDLGRHDSRTLEDHGLDPDATYYYSARGCNSVGCTRYSGETGGVTESAGQVDVPSIPTGVRGMKVSIPQGTDDARVTWSAAPGATYYEVYRGSDLDAEISAPQTGYYDGSPNNIFGAFQTTSYKVRACNKAGCSAFSETVTVS